MRFVFLHLLCIFRKPWNLEAVRFHAAGIAREF